MRFGPAAGEFFWYLRARKHKNSMFCLPAAGENFWPILAYKNTPPPPFLGTKIFKGGGGYSYPE